MHAKSFPLFDSLKTIFGKDRATGNMAESPADALEEMEAEGESTSNVNVNQNVPLNNNASEALTGQSSERKRRREEKRMIEDLYAELIGSFNRGMDMAREDLSSIASKIYVNIEGKSKGMIVEELEKMNLTEDEQIDAAIKLVDKPEYIDLFWAFNGQRRETFVKRILRHQGERGERKTN